MPTITWTDVLEIAPQTTTGMTEEEAAAANSLARPLMVFVYDDSDEKTDQRLLVEEDKVFFDWKVTTGAKFFDCMRIDKESAAEDRILKKHARKAPCLVLVRPNFTVAKVMRAKFKAKRVVAAMTTTVKKDYKNCIPCVVREQEELWKQRAKLDRERARVEASGKESRVQKIDSEIEKITASEEKLYELKAKKT